MKHRDFLGVIAIIFFTTTASAWVCANNNWIAEQWLAAWINRSGSLGGSRSMGTNLVDWWVTANIAGGFGSQTVNGQIACTSGAAPTSEGGNGGHCWCRMTVPFVRSWVYLGNFSHINNFCANFCSNRCAMCVQDGSNINDDCTRAAVLS